MSLLSEISSLTGGALSPDVDHLITLAKNALAEGSVVESPAGKAIADKAQSLFPSDLGDVVQWIDDLIPDSIEQQMGLSPEVKRFIKAAIGAHAKTTDSSATQLQ